MTVIAWDGKMLAAGIESGAVVAFACVGIEANRSTKCCIGNIAGLKQLEFIGATAHLHNSIMHGLEEWVGNMLCTRCGYKTIITDTREGSEFTTTRHRLCINCSAEYKTVEIPFQLYRSNMKRMQNITKAARNRIATWHKSLYCATELYKGWRPLAELYNVSKSGVYYLAAQGRKNLILLKRNK